VVDRRRRWGMEGVLKGGAFLGKGMEKGLEGSGDLW
jgi:hypothetical protein